MCIEWSTVWAAVSAIATSIGAITIFFAWRQLRFDAWLKAQEIWTAEDFTKKRGNVFKRLDTGTTEWTETEEAEALDVCRKMDEFARLVPYLSLIPCLSRVQAMRTWGVPFAKAWFILEKPIVRKGRDKCNWPNKWGEFEKLGNAALKKHPEVKKSQSPSG